MNPILLLFQFYLIKTCFKFSEDQFQEIQFVQINVQMNTITTQTPNNVMNAQTHVYHVDHWQFVINVIMPKKSSEMMRVNVVHVKIFSVIIRKIYLLKIKLF